MWPQLSWLNTRLRVLSRGFETVNKSCFANLRQCFRDTQKIELKFPFFSLEVNLNRTKQACFQEIRDTLIRYLLRMFIIKALNTK